MSAGSTSRDGSIAEGRAARAAERRRLDLHERTTEPICGLHGLDRAPAPPLTPGSVLDKYRIGEVLGSGALAVVYRATHLLLRAPVAIKLLHRELTRDPLARVYAAPEVVAGRPATFRSDVFSLGATLYEAATGHPLRGRADGAPEPLDPQCATSLGGLLPWMLARRPLDRPASYAELALALAARADASRDA